MATFNDKSNDGDIIVTELIFECIFGFHIILQFFVEYKENEGSLPIRNFETIAINYLTNDFIVHFLPMIPYHHIHDMGGYEKHFYFIKCMRAFRCGSIFDITRFMTLYKNWTKFRVDTII